MLVIILCLAMFKRLWNGVEEVQRSMKDNGGMVLKKCGYYILLSNFPPPLNKIHGSATAYT